MLTVYGRATSSNVQSVMWCLAELGLEADRIDLGEGFGGLDTPEFRAMNPSGMIPVLQDGDLTLFESAAIIRYLANTYGTPDFWPTDPGARAKVDQWAEWAKQNVANKFTGPVFWRVVRTPAPLRDPDAIRAGVEHLSRSLRVAEDQLIKTEWLTGDTLTPGDIHLGHVLYRYYDIEIDRPDLPVLRAYYDRLTQRQTYLDTVMISYDALRDTL
ncbi:MAG: glutathione S-transferase family protein [Pseudomonadota bacterium]